MASLGAYGLTFPGVPSARLVLAPDSWPAWTARVNDELWTGPQEWSDDRVVLRLAPVGHARIDRRTRTTDLLLPEPPVEEAWFHPLLGTTAVTVAAWSDWHCLHAGSFVDAAGGVWGILGDKERGKSSALAWLTVNGHQIVADDLLVARDRTVFAGPRCLDLRPAAARHFGIGADVGVLGGRRRWRVGLPAVAAELPLRGLVVLEWGEHARVERIELAEKAKILAGARGLLLPQVPAPNQLPLLSLPMLRFTRPHSWPDLDASMALLLRALSE